MGFITRFTNEKTSQNNFSCQNFSVENFFSLFFHFYPNVQTHMQEVRTILEKATPPVYECVCVTRKKIHLEQKFNE